MPESHDENAAAHALLDLIPVPAGPLATRIAEALDLVAAAAGLVADFTKTSGQQGPEEGEGRHGRADGTGLSPATPPPVPADDDGPRPVVWPAEAVQAALAAWQRESNSGEADPSVVDNDVTAADYGLDHGDPGQRGPDADPAGIPGFIEVLARAFSEAADAVENLHGLADDPMYQAAHRFHLLPEDNVLVVPLDEARRIRDAAIEDTFATILGDVAAEHREAGR